MLIVKIRPSIARHIAASLCALLLAVPGGLHAQEPDIEVVRVSYSAASTPFPLFSLDFLDHESGGVRYAIECSDDLGGGWVLDNGFSLFESVDIPGYEARKLNRDGLGREFFRVRRTPVPATVQFRPLAQSGTPYALTVDEGSGVTEVEVFFTDSSGASIFYNGPVKYIWSGDTGAIANLSGVVNAFGRSVKIPIDVLESAGVQDLRSLTLDLIIDPETPYSLDVGASSATLNILDNDGFWRGAFEVGGERHDIVLFIDRPSAGSATMELVAEESGIFGSMDTLSEQPLFTSVSFRARFLGIQIPGSAENLLVADTSVDLSLDALGQSSISDRRVTGQATLSIVPADAPHLVTQLVGTFFIERELPLQPDGTVALTIE